MFNIVTRIGVRCLTQNALVFAGAAVAAYGVSCMLDRRRPKIKDAVKVGVEGALLRAVIGPFASRLT